MNKVVLAFPSIADIALFVLDCKITHIQIDEINATLTGDFNDECLEIALTKYKATIAQATDFIK